MWQEIAIYIVAVCVLAYIGIWIYRTFFKKGKHKGYLDCSTCSGCALRDELFQQ